MKAKIIKAWAILIDPKNRKPYIAATDEGFQLAIFPAESFAEVVRRTEHMPGTVVAVHIFHPDRSHPKPKKKSKA